MPAALADFFFIAGLKGHEPAIVRAGASSSPVRAETPNETPTVHETPQDTLDHEENVKQSTRFFNDAPPSSADLPPTIPELSLLDLSTENASSCGLFDDVLAKFSSERDEFVLTLAPQSVAPPTRQTSIPRQQFQPPEEDQEDRVAELNASSQLRSRTSFRSKIADLSRRASQRPGMLRRHSTNGTPLTP
jgi:hypothetical protein